MKKLLTRGQMLAVAVVGGLFALAFITNPNFLKAPHVESAVVANANISGWVWSLGTKASGDPATANDPANPASYSTNPGSNPGLGWISFNSTSDGSSWPYGVNVDTLAKGTGGTGDFSGNAWIGNRAASETDGDTGWVSFDRTETGNPPGAPFNGGSGPIAQVDWSTGKVTGWMRVLTGMSAQAGGWDGWIKLSGAVTSATYTAGGLVAGTPTPTCSCDTGAGYNCPAVFTGSDIGLTCYDWWSSSGGPSKTFSQTSLSSYPYGVSIAGNKFSGYAWGSDVVGWVDFAPKIGGVSVGPVIGVPPCAVDAGGNLIGGGTWGTCQPLDSCATLGAGTHAGLNGIKVGVCTTGGTVTRSCNDATLVCAAAPSGGTPTTNCNRNGVCEAANGETPLTCSSDCKIRFFQF